jgi:hypothetical protein
MTAVLATSPDISPEFVARLAEQAQEAEELRRLPSATVNDFVASGFAELLVPARYGEVQAPWPSILDPVQRQDPRLLHPALVHIRVEGRYGVLVYQPAAIVSIDLTA